VRRRAVARLLAAAGLVFVLATSAYALANLYGNRIYVRDDMRSIASYIRERSQPGEAVVLVSGHMFPLAAYYGIEEGAYRLPDMETLSARRALAYDVAGRLNDIAAQHAGLWLILWQNDVVDPNGIVTGLLDGQAERLPVEQGFWGMELRHYRIRPGTVFAAPVVSSPLGANFGDRLTLVGFNLPSDVVVSGQTISLTLFWQAQQPLEEDYWQTLRLENAAGAVFGQTDQRPASYLYPTMRWQPGVANPGPASVLVRSGTPPGEYVLRLAVYAPERGQSLDILDSNGVPLDQIMTLARVRVVAP
jgi:hypothetical protein